MNSAKLINQEATNGTSSCCGNDNEGEDPCCSSKNNKNGCCNDQDRDDHHQHVEQHHQERNRVREYAVATICALSAILISKLALKIFYANR